MEPVIGGNLKATQLCLPACNKSSRDNCSLRHHAGNAPEFDHGNGDNDNDEISSDDNDDHVDRSDQR